MATAAQIRDKAISRMGVKSSSQTVQSAMKVSLDAAYSEVYAQLSALNIVTWDEDDEVPKEFIHPVVALTAYNRLDEYAIPIERYQRIIVDAGAAVAVIRAMQASNTYKTPEATYY